MSAQMIKLSDRRKKPPPPSWSLMDLPLSIFAAYVDIGAAVYLAAAHAAEQGLKEKLSMGFTLNPNRHRTVMPSDRPKAPRPRLANEEGNSA